MVVAGDGGELMNQERSPDDNLIISYLTLRKLVGWLGLSLPFVLPAGLLIFFSGKFPGSISGYYYTGMRNVLVGSLCVLGVFLAGYYAYNDELDFWITNLAGLFAVCVAFFPTQPAKSSPHQKDIGHIHFVFAALLFTMLAVMAMRFTKTGASREPTLQKKRRNLVYRICAVLIAASMLYRIRSEFPADVNQEQHAVAVLVRGSCCCRVQRFLARERRNIFCSQRQATIAGSSVATTTALTGPAPY